MLFVFGTIFFGLIALCAIALGTILPVRTSTTVEKIVELDMLPGINEGFKESNDAISVQLDSLRRTLVRRVREAVRNQYKVKSADLIKQIIPLLDNYFIDNAVELMQREVDNDESLAAIRYRLKESDELSVVGDDSTGNLIEIHSDIDNSRPGLQLLMLVRRESLSQAEDKEKAAVDNIENQLRITSGSLQDMILANAKNMQGSVTTLMKRDMWLAAVLICVFVVGISVVLLRRVVIDPLQKTKSHLLTIAEGDLTREFDYSSKNELGEMARAMNTMVENLRRIAGKIHDSAATVTSQSENLRDTTSALVSGARDQANRADGAATAMTEMAQSFMEVARNAANASDAARESNDLAQTGRATVEGTSAGMSAIAQKTSESSALIEELGRSGEKISNIVDVINEIADQTNLLALNAAIEAARAGEHGRGFAVVADEVRHLAARTGQATQEISQMIEKIQIDTSKSVESMSEVNKQVEQGVERADAAHQAMAGIVQSSDSSMQLIERIAAAVEQQSAAAEEVSANVENIAGVTRNTESLSTSMQEAAQELSSLSTELEEAISWFKLKNQ